MQVSITTVRPACRAMAAASSDTIPACSHNTRAPMATASRAIWGASAGGRNTSTEDLAGGAVHRDHLEALGLKIGGNRVGGLRRVGRGADHGDRPGGPVDLDECLVGEVHVRWQMLRGRGSDTRCNRGRRHPIRHEFPTDLGHDDPHHCLSAGSLALARSEPRAFGFARRPRHAPLSLLAFGAPSRSLRTPSV
jgi:hypothetical protein